MMSDFGNKAELMTTKFNQEPSRIRIEYIVGDEYIRCQPNGMLFISEPRGESTISFFLEHKDRLDHEIVKLSDNKPTEVVEQHGVKAHLENEMVINRIVLADIILTPKRLAELIDILTRHQTMQQARQDKK